MENSKVSLHRSCPSGCSSEHSHLRAASQAGGEDSCSAHGERQHQHWRERCTSLSAKWVLSLASCLCLCITPVEVNICERWTVFSVCLTAPFVLHLCLRH